AHPRTHSPAAPLAREALSRRCLRVRRALARGARQVPSPSLRPGGMPPEESVDLAPFCLKHVRLIDPMKNLAFLCSALLILTGLVGYFAWEAIGATKQSVTALIPAFVGVPMLIGAIIALKRNMLGMHIAVTF